MAWRKALVRKLPHRVATHTTRSFSTYSLISLATNATKNENKGNDALKSIIDFSRYPLNEPDGHALAAIVDNTRASLAETGAATFPGFLLPEALARAAAEVGEKAQRAHVTHAEHNMYQLPDGDPRLPLDHVRNRKVETRVASLAYDELDDRGTLKQLYRYDGLVEFIGRVIGQRQLYRLADPLGACSVNIFRPGWSHGYHFDEAEYTTTLCLQTAETGGAFVHSPRIRASNEDMAYERVQDVVSGTLPTSTLSFAPGTLSIFAGRYSLHAVEEVRGRRDRLVAVLCFATREGQKNSVDVQEMFWGRSL